MTNLLIGLALIAIGSVTFSMMARFIPWPGFIPRPGLYKFSGFLVIFGSIGIAMAGAVFAIIGIVQLAQNVTH